MGFFKDLFSDILVTDERPASVRLTDDPEYQTSALEKIRRNARFTHDRDVRNAEHAVKKAKKERQHRIDIITKNRWKDLGQGVRLNTADGKIIIAKKEYPLQSVQGAHAYVRYEEQHNWQTVKEHYREPSVGKAVLGGMMFGATGAIAGAAIGNKKTTSRVEDHVQNVETGRGVIINITGFDIDVPGAGQPMVDTLAQAVKTFDPDTVIPVEKLPEITAMDSTIETLEREVLEAQDKPLVYVIPDMYKDPDYDYAYDGTQLTITPRDEAGEENAETAQTNAATGTTKLDEEPQVQEWYPAGYQSNSSEQETNA